MDFGTSSGDGIGRFVQRIIDSSGKVVFAGVVAALISVCSIAAYRYVRPLPVTISSAIVVTMADVEKGKYPNGAPYSPTDLRSAPVLEGVYKANDIGKYGISLATFQGYVSVESYSPAYSFMAERYRERLSNKTLTFDEKKLIEEEFRSAEASLRASGLVVNLTLPENTRIPETIASKIVADIPAKWAEIFVERLGVAKLPFLTSGTDLVNTELAAELDYPLAYDYLDDQANGLRSAISDALSVPGASTFVSPTTGTSLSDLSREFNSIYQFRIKLGLKPLIDKGLSKDPATTSLIYENAIANINRDANAQTGYAQSIQSILESFRTSSAAPLPTSAGAVAVSPVTTQIDGAFIDKIVELTSKGDGLQFEQELQREKLQRQNDKVLLEEQRSRYSDRLSAIRQGLAEKINDTTLEKKYVEGFAAAVNDLNSIWKQTAEIGSELGLSKLNADKSLYRLSELPDSRKVAKPPLFGTISLLLLIATTVIALLMACAYFAFWPEFRRRLRAP